MMHSHSCFVEDCRIEVTVGICDELPLVDSTVFSIPVSPFFFEAKPSFEAVVSIT